MENKGGPGRYLEAEINNTLIHKNGLDLGPEEEKESKMTTRQASDLSEWRHAGDISGYEEDWKSKFEWKTMSSVLDI